MRILLAAVVSAVLFAPSICNADVLTLVVSDFGEMGVSFGLAPFELSSPFSSNEFDVEGSVSIVSGPLLSQTVDEENAITSYVYGAGRLTLSAFGETDDGEFVSGGFSAATMPFQIDVEEDADDLFGGGLADDFWIVLGEGRFDKALARLFAVHYKTTGGEILLGLEDIEGGPETVTRIAVDHRGEADLDIYTRSVPEPTLLGLGLASVVGWMSRKRSRQMAPGKDVT
jgi:hypothetical protein